MKSRDFIFWLQGYFELNDPKTIDEKTIKIIRNHVNLVFKYEIDPSYSDDPKVQAELQAIHDGDMPDVGYVSTILNGEPPHSTTDIWNAGGTMFPNSGDEVFRC